MSPTITYLGRNHLPAAVEIFSQAFADDPMMRSVFAPSISPYTRSLEALFHFSCEMRFWLEWPLLGCWDGNQQLVGVAAIGLPGQPLWPPALQQSYARFEACVGAEAAARFEIQDRLASTNRPTEPHYHLALLGVAPQQQGRGYGRRLLQALHELSDSDASSVGVWLDTETPSNVSWYEKSGYQVKLQTDWEGVTIWGMLRPASW